MTVPPTTLSEKLQDQLTDINQALHLIEHTLAQDWQLAQYPAMMADEMFANDQSFADLLDACTQNVGKRPRVAADGIQRPGKGHAARSSPSSVSTLNGGNDDLLRMLAGLTLRQDAIS